MTNFLSPQQISHMAPSVFADVPHGRVSDRYMFVSTAEMLETIGVAGFSANPQFGVVVARQQRVRDSSRTEFCKHIIRLRSLDCANMPVLVGDTFPEIVITNAHDGTSSRRIQSGLFRLACDNGLVVSMVDKFSQSIPHREKWREDVLEGVYTVMEEMPQVATQVANWQKIELSPRQVERFGEMALAIRYPDGNAPIAPSQITRPRRYNDKYDSLWNVFNRTQENIMRGGLYGINPNGRRHTTRRVNGIDAELNYNERLWDAAAQMAESLQ